YDLLGLKAKPHRLFEDIAWSTERVADQTLERAAELGLPVHILPTWYDVDNVAGLKTLRAELLEGQLCAPDLGPAQPRQTRALIQALLETSDLKDRPGLTALPRPEEKRGSRHPIGRSARSLGACFPCRPAAQSRLRTSMILKSASFFCSSACLMPLPHGSWSGEGRSAQGAAARSRPFSSSALSCAACSCPERRSRPTSSATSGTAACKPPASIRIFMYRATRRCRACATARSIPTS